MFNLFTVIQRVLQLKLTVCGRCPLTFPHAGSLDNQTNTDILHYLNTHSLYQLQKQIKSSYIQVLNDPCQSSVVHNLRTIRCFLPFNILH